MRRIAARDIWGQAFREGDRSTISLPQKMPCAAISMGLFA